MQRITASCENHLFGAPIHEIKKNFPTIATGMGPLLPAATPVPSDPTDL